jgi:hypothetical protein
MLGSRDRIDDRLAARFDQIRDLQPSLARVDVDLEIDVGEDRIVDFREGTGKDLEHRGAGLGILTAEDAQQGFALWRARAPVDDDAGFPVAFVDGARPRQDERRAQPVEPRRAVVSFVDLHADDGPTVAVGRQGVELARTAIGAIAVAELPAFEHPFRLRHVHLRLSSLTGTSDCIMRPARSATSYTHDPSQAAPGRRHDPITGSPRSCCDHSA